MRPGSCCGMAASVEMPWLGRKWCAAAVLFVVVGVSRVAASAEGDALFSLQQSLKDPNNVLQSWDPTLANPCSWFHVTCNNDSSVIRLDLGNSGLSGALVSQLGRLKNLQYLELYSNNISGTIPSELGNLTNLVSLDLYLNNFTGVIPDTLGQLLKLRLLRLNNNSLCGQIPLSLTNIATLQVLDVSNNYLSGEIPSNGSFEYFTPMSFANQKYGGPGTAKHCPKAPSLLPNRRKNCGSGTTKPCPGAPFSRSPPSKPMAPFLSHTNQNNCGPGTTKPCPGAPFSPPPPEPTEGSSKTEAIKSGELKVAAIAGGVGAGAALIVAVPVAVGFVMWRQKKPEEHSFDVPAEEYPDVHLGQLKRFSLTELEVASDNFSDNNILGRGSFGNVYKGILADGTLVAVKRLTKEYTPVTVLQFQAEMKMVSRAVHKNLLRLRGICVTPIEWLLVFPYMANGSVASRLREQNPDEPPLDLQTRTRIALGSARGLSYLHNQCDPKIIHRDVKSANILLDKDFEAVVSDFGLARFMDHKDIHITINVRGTMGHIAPECMSTGNYSAKSDVFAYGVMLLELITGQGPIDLARRANGDDVLLLDWVKGLLKEKKVETLVDPNLHSSYVDQEVAMLIQVALLCTQGSPMDRPGMSEVVRMLEGDGLAERWEEWQKMEVVQQEAELATSHNYWIVDSTYKPRAEELSGPR